MEKLKLMVSVCECFQWLLEQQLVQKLVAMIDPSQTSEVIPACVSGIFSF